MLTQGGRSGFPKCFIMRCRCNERMDLMLWNEYTVKLVCKLLLLKRCSLFEWRCNEVVWRVCCIRCILWWNMSGFWEQIVAWDGSEQWFLDMFHSNQWHIQKGTRKMEEMWKNWIFHRIFGHQNKTESYQFGKFLNYPMIWLIWAKPLM